MAPPDRYFFCKIIEFKRIAMRADKTDHSFQANIYLAAAVINVGSLTTQPTLLRKPLLHHAVRHDRCPI